MKNVIGILSMIVVMMSVITYVVVGGTNNLKQDNVVVTIHQDMESSLQFSRDDSARVEKGIFKFDKDMFEKRFTSLIKKEPGIGEKLKVIMFDYVPDTKGGYKGVKVKVTTDVDTYQGTLVLSNGKDKSDA